MIKKMVVWSLTGLFLTLFAVFSQPASALDVYAEGAYTDTDLHVYIYADIDGAPLVSFGVKLTYSSNLTPVSAEKNETVWYMGDGTVAGNKPYMDPDTSAAGEIVFIGGKLDTADATAGVAGTRVLLGKAVFSRTDANPVSVSLSLGRDNGTYKNFVSNDKSIRDDDPINFSQTVVERGDANADSVITFADMSKIRAIMNEGIYVVYSDCNDDGVITFADMSCVRSKM